MNPYLPPPAAANPIPSQWSVGDKVSHADSDGAITGTVTQVFDNQWVVVAWDESTIHSDQLAPLDD